MKTNIIILTLLVITAYADKNEITLTLSSPFTEMIAYEWASLSVTISNNSSQAIYVVKDPAAVMDYQMVLDFDKPQLRYFEAFSFSESSQKKRFSQKNREGNLAPGESYTWTLPPCYGDLTRAFLEYGATELAALFPIGNGQWIRSNTVPLKILPDTSGEVLFDESLRNEKSGKMNRIILYKKALNKKSFIFTSWGERICEIPDSAVPKMHLNTNTHILMISFSNEQNNVQYNLETMQRE